MNKKYLDNVILLNQNFLCGAFYYAVEYFDYLLKNNLNTYLVLHKFFKSLFNFLIHDKYDVKKLHKDFFKKIIFYPSSKEKMLIAKNLIILDGTTYWNKPNFIIFENLFYNYGDDELSLKEKLKVKKLKKVKFFIFGDKEMNLHVDYHYPLCLNFQIFKEIKNFQKGERIENFKEKKMLKLDHRLNKNFHESFDTLKYIQNENFWERSNRLIPECKFYGKKIIFEPKSYIDSAQLRYEKDWKEYDIWRFKSPDTGLTFADWIKKETNVN